MIPRKTFFGGSPKLRFCSLRHNAIYEQEVDFEENCVKQLFVAWSCGTWTNKHVGSYITSIIPLDLDFMPPRPNCQHVPE
jgi:hypothetical protein